MVIPPPIVLEPIYVYIYIFSFAEHSSERIKTGERAKKQRSTHHFCRAFVFPLCTTIMSEQQTRSSRPDVTAQQIRGKIKKKFFCKCFYSLTSRLNHLCVILYFSGFPFFAFSLQQSYIVGEKNGYPLTPHISYPSYTSYYSRNFFRVNSLRFYTVRFCCFFSHSAFWSYSRSLRTFEKKRYPLNIHNNNNKT